MRCNEQEPSSSGYQVWKNGLGLLCPLIEQCSGMMHYFCVPKWSWMSTGYRWTGGKKCFTMLIISPYSLLKCIDPLHGFGRKIVRG
jgi:hypothetical protein